MILLLVNFICLFIVFLIFSITREEYSWSSHLASLECSSRCNVLLIQYSSFIICRFSLQLCSSSGFERNKGSASQIRRQSYRGGKEEIEKPFEQVFVVIRFCTSSTIIILSNCFCNEKQQQTKTLYSNIFDFGAQFIHFKLELEALIAFWVATVLRNLEFFTYQT